MLPNTIAWTFTAVPRSSGISFIWRYLMARGLCHDSNTAKMASRSCSRASCGKVLPARSRTNCLKRRIISCMSSAVSSVSSFTFRVSLMWSMIRSKSCFGTPRTTSENIWMNRR